MLVMFEDQTRWYLAVAWLVKRLAAPGTYAVSGVRLLHAADGTVVYERRGPEWATSLWPASQRPRPDDASRGWEYFKGRLQRFGGNKEAYELLGVPRPQVSLEVAPESREAHDELYVRAARLLGVAEAELRQKYGHLNPGLQAMNLRNRLRAKGHNV